jgi:hypothetical protein
MPRSWLKACDLFGDNPNSVAAQFRCDACSLRLALGARLPHLLGHFWEETLHMDTRAIQVLL